jgi:hypothetical protein
MLPVRFAARGWRCGGQGEPLKRRVPARRTPEEVRQ